MLNLTYKLLVALLVVANCYWVFKMANVFIPVYTVKGIEDPEVRNIVNIFNINEAKASTIVDASRRYGYDPKLIACLAKTESDFKMSAVSPKGYKSVMQTPHTTGFMDLDYMYGVRILHEKMQETNGNLERALARYKGGENPMAYRQAQEVLAMYKRIIHSGEI